MFDQELPVVRLKKIPPTLLEKDRETCLDNGACCDTELTLARLYGDRNIAKERCFQVCAQVKKIDEDELASEIKIFKAVADVTRLKILKLLSGGELCIGEIMLALKKPQSSVSHNLSILEDAGLIKERKQGKWCHYRITDATIMDMVELARSFQRK
jgi:DNA-binding transcriptional ArsR family regulator